MTSKQARGECRVCGMRGARGIAGVLDAPGRVSSYNDTSCVDCVHRMMPIEYAFYQLGCVMRDKAQQTFKQGVRAAWRQMRVNTDGDMSVLVDAWRVGAYGSMHEIADDSNGRITVETDEQLRDGIIAVAWEIELHHPLRGAPYLVLQPDGQPKPKKRKYLGSSRAVYRGMVHDEVDVDIEEIHIEFTGTVTHVGLYAPDGHEALLILVADPQPRVVAQTDYFRLGDRVLQPMLTCAGRLVLIARSTLISKRFDNDSWERAMQDLGALD